MGNRHSQPRRNSNDYYNNLQYTTKQGSVPARIVAHQINRAPPRGERTTSRYPRIYRNEEGSADAPKQNFHAWELRPQAELYEYPVARANKPQFDYNQRTKSAIKVQLPIHPNDRGRVVRHPPNDAGAIRGVTDRCGNIVGVMAHPVDNSLGYERARLEPLNRQGRQDLRRYQNQAGVYKSPTWPPE